MSLQEEIATMFDGAYQAGKDGVTPPKGSEFAAKESATIVFNKVLDAVIEKFEEEADQVLLEGDYEKGIHDAHRIEAPRIINKLRPKS